MPTLHYKYNGTTKDISLSTTKSTIPALAIKYGGTTYYAGMTAKTPSAGDLCCKSGGTTYVIGKEPAPTLTRTQITADGYSYSASDGSDIMLLCYNNTTLERTRKLLLSLWGSNVNIGNFSITYPAFFISKSGYYAIVSPDSTARSFVMTKIPSNTAIFQWLYNKSYNETQLTILDTIGYDIVGNTVNVILFSNVPFEYEDGCTLVVDCGGTIFPDTVIPTSEGSCTLYIKSAGGSLTVLSSTGNYTSDEDMLNMQFDTFSW